MKPHRTDTMMALARIGELVTMSLDTSEILKQVVTITAEIMKVDVCSIYLYEDSESMLVLAATIGLRVGAVGKVRLAVGEGITGRAAKQGRIVAVRDVYFDKRHKYFPDSGEEIYHSILSVPLKFHDENIGVINVQTKRPRTYLKNERQLLKTIAHQVSGLIRNARLYESVLAAKKELEHTNERLIESEKMAALGRLSATLSHELRNPLAGLKGAAQLLSRKTGDGDERKLYVNLIIDEVERLGKIVEDLIHFAKPKSLQYGAVDANRIIDDALLLHSGEFSHRKIIVRKRLSKLPTLLADGDKLKQVFVNIILNSLDAMPAGGELLISSSVTMSEEGPGDVATFQFRDTGPGIPGEVLEHVFEPFFTTKPDGVGLGLAVCKTIIEQHGGMIRVETGKSGEGNRGTLISLTVPVNGKP